MEKKDLEDIEKTLKKELVDLGGSLRKDLAGLNKDVRSKLAKIDSFLLDIKKSFKEHLSVMKETLKVNECAEETLGNVLLAIRQNEYLQAWYPEQHGFTSMKVSGKHPAKLRPIDQ
jgi:hypothetical protein